MFVPALLLRRSIAPLVAAPAVAGVRGAARAPAPRRSAWAAPPCDLLGVALAHGAGVVARLDRPALVTRRRSRQGTSPLRAALGYAILTMIVGLAVERDGQAGLALTQGALGLAAVFACAYGLAKHGHVATG